MINPRNFAVVERQAKALSIKYYNESLDFVKDDKITYAIERLKKSVEFDKRNIQAQNLLGLMYYRLGRVTNAYIHWGVSAKFDKSEANDAHNYLQDILNSVEYDEKCKAVSKYNECLKLTKRGNYDMAVMQLKRGLDFNPNSVDLLNLLAYCYIAQGDNHDAYKYVDKVLRIDKSNPTAKRYKSIIKPDRLSIFRAKDDDLSETSVYSNYVNHTSEQRAATAKNSLIFFILGIVLTSIVCGALIIPAVFKHYERQIGNYETEYGVLKNKTDEEIAKKDESIKTLTQENEGLKTKLDTAGTNGLQERVRTLAEIETAYKDGNIEVAADRLVALNNTGFTGEVLEQYRSLCQSVLVAAAEKYFNDGQDYQDNEEYDLAIESYNKCLRCSQDGGEIGLNATFQLGKIAQAQGDSEKAKEYFTTVAQNHPVDAIKEEAQQYLDEN